MADEIKDNNDVNLSDVIKEQSDTIKTLVSEVKKGTPATGAQPIYMTSPQRTADTSPNYLMFAGVGLAIWFLFRGR